MAPVSAARLADDRISPNRAALRAAPERKKPDAERWLCEMRPAKHPRRSCDFRVRTPSPKAIGCDPQVPTSIRPANVPGLLQEDEDTNAPARQPRPKAAKTPGSRKAKPLEYRRWKRAAGRRRYLRGSD